MFIIFPVYLALHVLKMLLHHVLRRKEARLLDSDKVDGGIDAFHNKLEMSSESESGVTCGSDCDCSCRECVLECGSDCSQCKCSLCSSSDERDTSEASAGPSTESKQKAESDHSVAQILSNPVMPLLVDTQPVGDHAPSVSVAIDVQPTPTVSPLGSHAGSGKESVREDVDPAVNKGDDDEADLNTGIASGGNVAGEDKEGQMVKERGKNIQLAGQKKVFDPNSVWAGWEGAYNETRYKDVRRKRWLRPQGHQFKVCLSKIQTSFLIEVFDIIFVALLFSASNFFVQVWGIFHAIWKQAIVLPVWSAFVVPLTGHGVHALCHAH